ncbi:MAG TPA: tripartite tricarboxylate transporter substrate binding protein [Burkholderiales bacterium]
MSTAARAQSAAGYPNKPVRIIIGYGAGGTGDVTMRILAQKLTERTGQQFIVDNRPGAGGIVASQVVAGSPPDGYTLLFVATGNFTMTPGLFKHLPFDPVKDFEMISLSGNFGFALIVGDKSPIKDVKDFIARCKAAPGKINVATVAAGTAQYLAAEYFKSVAGINFTTVPFKTSGDVVAAVRGGAVDLGFETLAPILSFLPSGQLRALAVTDPVRFPTLPNVPTVKESGVPGYAVYAWNGLGAPAKTPRDIVDKLNAEIKAAIAAPDMQKKMLDLGIVPKATTPEEMTALLKRDMALWAGVIDRAHIEKQ